GAAINTAIIAAIRNADPQVGDKAQVFVAKPHDLITGIAERQRRKERQCCRWFLSKYGRPGRFRLNPCPCNQTARSRRDSQGMPKGRSGRNLKTHYRPGTQIGSEK